MYGETLGVGVDVAFETAGEQDSLDTSLICVRPHGTLVNIAVGKVKAAVDCQMHADCARAPGIFASGKAYPEALRALADGNFGDLEGLVTKKIGLEDIVSEGITSLLQGEEVQGEVLAFRRADLLKRFSPYSPRPTVATCSCPSLLNECPVNNLDLYS